MKNNPLEPRLTTADVCRITAWSRWTLLRRIDAGKFPKPERVGDVMQNTWRESVLREWMEKNVTVREVA